MKAASLALLIAIGSATPAGAQLIGASLLGNLTSGLNDVLSDLFGDSVRIDFSCPTSSSLNNICSSTSRDLTSKFGDLLNGLQSMSGCGYDFQVVNGKCLEKSLEAMCNRLSSLGEMGISYAKKMAREAYVYNSGNYENATPSIPEYKASYARGESSAIEYYCNQDQSCMQNIEDKLPNDMEEYTKSVLASAKIYRTSTSAGDMYVNYAKKREEISGDCDKDIECMRGKVKDVNKEERSSRAKAEADRYALLSDSLKKMTYDRDEPLLPVEEVSSKLPPDRRSVFVRRSRAKFLQESYLAAMTKNLYDISMNVKNMIVDGNYFASIVFPSKTFQDTLGKIPTYVQNNIKN